MKLMNRGRIAPGAAAGLLMVLAGGCTTAPPIQAPAALPLPEALPLRCDQPGNTCLSDLMAALEAWKDAYNARDPRQLQALYAPGALITDDDNAAVPLSGAGLPRFFDDMAAKPTARMRWLFGNLQIFGDTAVRSGNYEFSDEAGEHKNTRPARYSFAYQRINGRWLIVLQHSTVRP